MQEWIPVPGSSKGKLAVLALEEFGRRGYDGVNVVALAERSGLTTGSLYHHFGSKRGLYEFVRREVERRILDRIEGAAAALAEEGEARAVRAALLVAFDVAVRQGYARLLAEPRPDATPDPIEEALGRIVPGRTPARLLLAAWREALAVVADGEPAAEVRRSLSGILPV